MEASTSSIGVAKTRCNTLTTVSLTYASSTPSNTSFTSSLLISAREEKLTRAFRSVSTPLAFNTCMASAVVTEASHSGKVQATVNTERSMVGAERPRTDRRDDWEVETPHTNARSTKADDAPAS